MKDLLEAVREIVERRERLCRQVPTCPCCGEKHQIQLVRWLFAHEVLWRCRMCLTWIEGALDDRAG